MFEKGSRIPTMQNSLEALLDAGVEVSCVLDVGMLTGTGPLIRTFPNVPHHLFEPVDLHFQQLEKNYKNIDSKLHHVALSDSDGEIYLACRAIHGDGRITHSEVVEKPVTTEDIPDLVSCKPIRRACLDTILEGEDIRGGLLLKIDVDGHEMSVLRGADKTLELASIVVIEAPINRVELPHFFERSNYLMSKGFCLMDIVDLAYYDGVLWQVDLVFVKKEIVNKADRLRPFEASAFSFEKEKWYPSGDRLYKNR